jgi:intergrase/recombinase
MINGRIYRDVFYTKNQTVMKAKKEEYKKKGYYTRIATESGARTSYILWVANKNLSKSEIHRENRKYSSDKGINRNLSIGQAHQRQRKRKRAS